MSHAPTLARTMFETSRAVEYFNARELQAQTGQPVEHFASVALKELVDNALDACETAGVAPVVSIEVEEEGGFVGIAIADNGAGLQPETVQRILNFNTRTSDKSAYRTPTRGAQGNALKTVIGMPCALGSRVPLTIEAHGTRHSIKAWIDPAGELQIEHETKTTPTLTGTRIRLALPLLALGNFWPQGWARAFSLFNPHASVKIRDSTRRGKHANSAQSEDEDFYQATVAFPGEWRKFLPTDLPSPWWYDLDALRRLVFAYIGASRRGDRDLTLRDFVRQFRGLSGSAKAKRVCDQFPTVGRLSDFERGEALLEPLLAAMRAEAQPPAATVLGVVGEDHYRARFDAWYGVKRWWYRKSLGEVDGVPYAFEVALAETERQGNLYHAINFSPTFEDPLADTRLVGPKYQAWGLRSFLTQGHASPIDVDFEWEQRTKTAVAVHLVCPALEFLDRGKTRLKPAPAMAEAIAQTLWRAIKEVYEEEERYRKDAAREERAARARVKDQNPKESSLKEIVFHVMLKAANHAGGGGKYPYSTRTLYYAVRPLIQPYTNKDLDYNYFSQVLLPAYQAADGELVGLYYDPRGYLYEPHTGKALPLGTREVEGYDFPMWLYDKILYVEKKGLWPVLKAAKLAERYDMAVVAAEGYATAAARTLFDRADKDCSYKLFVLHDADPYGYNIARTLREETRRMPGYQVEVADLGLKLEEALSLKLQTEEFTRKKALPEGLELTPVERQLFEGRMVGRSAWVCQRVELNAFSAPALVTYIEQGLESAGAVEKVIPPDEELDSLTEELYTDQVSEWVDNAIAELLTSDDIKANIAESMKATILEGKPREWIEEAFKEDRALGWEEAVKSKLKDLLDDEGERLEGLLRDAIDEMLERD